MNVSLSRKIHIMALLQRTLKVCTSEDQSATNPFRLSGTNSASVAWLDVLLEIEQFLPYVDKNKPNIITQIKSK